jgi:hypothetical protein
MSLPRSWYFTGSTLVDRDTPKTEACVATAKAEGYLMPERSARDVAGAHESVVNRAARATMPVATSPLNDRVLERGPTPVLAHDFPRAMRADPS